MTLDSDSDSVVLSRIAEITALALKVQSAGISVQESTGPRIRAHHGEVPQEALDADALRSGRSAGGGLFAAAPLGDSAGALWIADPRPRDLDAAARELLDSLATVAERECNLAQQ